MSKRQKKKNRRQQYRSEDDSSPTINHAALFVSEYKVTDEPMWDKNFTRLPADVQEQIQELFYIVHRSPQKAIPILEGLIEKYPHIPQLYNYLSNAYTKTGDIEKTNAIVLENYRKHPDYLFGKCNYAEFCIQKGELEKVPLIFDGKFDLKMLYPKRKTFHVSEVAVFMGTMGFYFHKIGKQQIAKTYFDILQQLSPKHPLTRRLRRMLHPPLLLRLLMKLTGKPKARGR